MQLICTGMATHLLQVATHNTRQEIYNEFLEHEYEINDVQESILVNDEDAFFNFIMRDLVPLLMSNMRAQRHRLSTCKRSSSRLSAIICIGKFFGLMPIKHTKFKKSI